LKSSTGAIRLAAGSGLQQRKIDESLSDSGPAVDVAYGDTAQDIPLLEYAIIPSLSTQIKR